MAALDDGFTMQTASDRIPTHPNSQLPISNSQRQTRLAGLGFVAGSWELGIGSWQLLRWQEYGRAHRLLAASCHRERTVETGKRAGNEATVRGTATADARAAATGFRDRFRGDRAIVGRRALYGIRVAGGAGRVSGPPGSQGGRGLPGGSALGTPRRRLRNVTGAQGHGAAPLLHAHAPLHPDNVDQFLHGCG